VVPRALETEEIPRLVSEFGHAARLGYEAGFDGVDIHAANGYLIDQFIRDGSNRRTDQYGGSIANRVRFLIEVAEAVAGVWGSDRVGVRISPLSGHHSMSDSDPSNTFAHVAASLRRAGVVYLHAVGPGPGHPHATEEGRRLLRALRGEFGGCFVVDGGRDRASAETALAAVDADLVALATPFIANPDLVERLARGVPLTVPDPTTFYTGGERGYTDYPASVQRLTHAPGLDTHAVGTADRRDGRMSEGTRI
jgi:N-ethylmaleimide reductase